MWRRRCTRAVYMPADTHRDYTNGVFFMRGRYFHKKECGQALVEFALVLPLFLAMVLFIIEVGWIIIQRTVFDQGYMYSSWSVTADKLGDSDTLDETPSHAIYYGTVVIDAMMDGLKESDLWGFEPGNVSIINAEADLYNMEETYHVPGRTPADVILAVNRTRYMDLSADISYSITPLTFFGRFLFDNSITVEKEISCTRVVASQHRSE